MTLFFVLCVAGWILINSSNIAEAGELVGSNATQVDLSFRNLTTLEQADWVDNYPMIRFLNASHSSIETIGILESLTLEEINISYGQLRWVRSGSFRHIKHLKKLMLNHNRHLTTIDLASSSLVYLDASHCSVTEASLQYARNLQVLNLSHNRVKEFRDVDLSDCTNLEDADLSNNDIEVIDDYTFIKLTKLERLNLAQNKIANTDWAITLNNLKTLDVSFNNIESIELLMLRHAVVLNISNNKLTQLPEEINRLLPYLERLDVTSNPIRKIYRLKSKNLQQLLLPECRINEISPDAFRESDLKFIDVSDNKLRNWEFVRFLKNATILLADNPWQCVCNATLNLALICQPGNISLSAYCDANREEVSQDPWFLEATNPIIWAPLIVALVIIVVAGVSFRTYKKYREKREREEYKTVPIDLIQNLPEEHLNIMRELLLGKAEPSPKPNRQHSRVKPVSV